MFDHEYANQTALGTYFGVSSHVVGRWLDELGLWKVGHAPTRKAFDLGLPKKAPTNRGNGNGSYFIWHIRKTVKLLEEAGHRRIQKESPSAPKPILVAPFSLRQSGDYFEILNADGDVFCWCLGEKATAFIVQIFNKADDNNILSCE